MRLGAQTGTPPGVCKESAVNLRQAAFYRHSIHRNACLAAADSHIFRSQALTDDSKLALNFSDKSGEQIRHAPDSADKAAYCRFQAHPKNFVGFFRGFREIFFEDGQKTTVWGAHASGVLCSASRRTPRTTDFLFTNEGPKISYWSRSRDGSLLRAGGVRSYSEVQTLWSGSEINKELCENM